MRIEQNMSLTQNKNKTTKSNNIQNSQPSMGFELSLEEMGNIVGGHCPSCHDKPKPKPPH